MLCQAGPIISGMDEECSALRRLDLELLTFDTLMASRGAAQALHTTPPGVGGESAPARMC